jgi:hypothetical protein
MSAAFRDAMAQFDWDIFMPIDNEEELESLAGDYLKQDELNISYVVAGIVFEPDFVESSFKKSTVKIRTNFSAVVDPSQYRLE